MDKKIFINDAANILGVNKHTLRRWDKSGRFKAGRKKSGKISYYIYEIDDLINFLTTDFRTLKGLAIKWSFSATPIEVPQRFYCADKSIFKARLSRFEFDLSQNQKFSNIFSLIVAIAGEIGNNSFDHNLGNWPDINGIFFGYNIKARKVILADRGQGVLTTLKQVRPALSNYDEALKIAFTEIISGRSPERRGNGLKFVKDVVLKYNFKLFFQSGDAILNLGRRNNILKIKKSDNFMRGCFAIINF